MGNDSQVTCNNDNLITHNILIFSFVLLAFRSDFRPFFTFIQSSDSCSYDSILRAKNILMILKIPYSKLTRQSESNTDYVRYSDKEKENKASVGVKLNRNPIDDDTFSMQFESLTPSKVKSLITIDTALQLKGEILNQFLRCNNLFC